MITLSDRQHRILDFIISFVEENEFPPTIREIGKKVGISSTSVVNYNLAKLEELKLLARKREVSRGLSLNWDRLVEQNLVDGDHTAHTLAPAMEPASNGAGRHFKAPVRVPVLGPIAAGEPIRVEPREAANPEEWVEIAEGLLGNTDELFALRVQGDSMIDASVLDGDIVILRHQDTADNGDMVAAWIEGDEETTLKFIYHDPGSDNVRLQPANPNPVYQPIIRPAENVRINGKVVSVIRLLQQ